MGFNLTAHGWGQFIKKLQSSNTSVAVRRFSLWEASHTTGKTPDSPRNEALTLLAFPVTRAFASAVGH